MIFDTSKLTALQRQHFNEVISTYDYEWDQMLPLLKKKPNRRRTHIPVVVIDIPARWGACALSWPDGSGLQIDDQVAPDAIGPESWLWFHEVVMHELGHQVDFFGLSNKVREQVRVLLGDWSLGCLFCIPFGMAFSTYKFGDADIPASRIVKLRNLLGGVGPVPAKVEMTA